MDRKFWSPCFRRTVVPKYQLREKRSQGVLVETSVPTSHSSKTLSVRVNRVSLHPSSVPSLPWSVPYMGTRPLVPNQTTLVASFVVSDPPQFVTSKRGSRFLPTCRFHFHDRRNQGTTPERREKTRTSTDERGTHSPSPPLPLSLLRGHRDEYSCD